MLLLYNLLMNFLAVCICVLRMVVLSIFFLCYICECDTEELLANTVTFFPVIHHTHEITQGTLFIMC